MSTFGTGTFGSGTFGDPSGGGGTSQVSKVSATSWEVSPAVTSVRSIGWTALQRASTSTAITWSLTPETGSLVDTFDGPSLGLHWTETQSSPDVVGGRLRLNSAANAYVRTPFVYDFTGSFLQVRLDPTSLSGSVTHQIRLETNSADSTKYYAIGYANGLLRGLKDNTSVLNVAYDPIAHAYVRISEAAGTVRWSVSPNGLTWTDLFSATHSANLTASRVHLQAYGGTGYAYFDDLNVGTQPVSSFASAGWSAGLGAISSASIVWMTRNFMSALTDHFDGLDIDRTKWKSVTGNAVIESGQLKFPGTDPGKHVAVTTDYLYDLNWSSVSARIIPPTPVPDATTTYYRVYMSLFSKTQVDLGVAPFEMGIEGTTGGQPRVNMGSEAGGPSPSSFPYDPVQHAYWRLREAGGTFYWDTSSDGVTWTNRGQKTVTVVRPEGYQLQLASDWLSSSGPVADTYFDDVVGVDTGRVLPPASVYVTWNSQSNVQATAGVSWNVRLPVEAGQSISWNAYLPVSNLTSTTWTVQRSIVSAASTAWTARLSVGRAQSVGWSVLVPVSITWASSWTVHASASALMSVTWTTLALSQATAQALWVERSLVSASTATTWPVRALLFAAQSIDWQVGLNVASTTQTAWTVHSSVSAGAQAGWDVHCVVGAESSIDWVIGLKALATAGVDWDTRQAVASSAPVIWTAQQQATTQQTVTWSINTVQGLTGSASVSWSIAASAQASVSSGWTVRASVLHSAASAWTVTGVVLADRSTTWTVRAAVTSYRSIVWAAYLPFNGSASVSWQALQRLAQGESVAWLTRATTANVRQVLWISRGLLGSESQVTWDSHQAAGTNASVEWQTDQRLVILAPVAWSLRNALEADHSVSWRVFIPYEFRGPELPGRVVVTDSTTEASVVSAPGRVRVMSEPVAVRGATLAEQLSAAAEEDL